MADDNDTSLPPRREQAGSAREPDTSNGNRKYGLLTTGDMARLSNNTLRTVRFYEEAKILHPIQRTDGGHRLFDQSELRKLELVSELRAAGLSLEEIRELLEVKQRATNGSAASRDALTRLEGQIKRMSERIEILTRLRDDLQASRGVLQECQSCTGSDLYPDGCRNCSVMTDQSSLPKAVSVVWSVDRR
ncbi:MAG: MerR family transcriptional regulator [Polyangiaceae bacterium]